MGYYFVTAPEEREPKKVSAFKDWMRREIAGELRGIGI